MSAKLPALSGRAVIRALRGAGFYVERIKGSHHILVHQNDERLTVIVPVHGNKDLKVGTLRNIIKQAGLSSDEFQALL